MYRVSPLVSRLVRAGLAVVGVSAILATGAVSGAAKAAEAGPAGTVVTVDLANHQGAAQ